MRPDTRLILAICALLIVNSHLEGFYPLGWQFLAADGLLGNSLFYMLSGFGIQFSLMSREQEFLSYMRRRILRIYPTLILVVGILSGIVGGKFLTWNLPEYFSVFVWPTSFGYVEWIVLFYAAGYLLFLPRSVGVLGAAIAALWVIYVCFYVQHYPSLAADAKLSLGASDERIAVVNYASLFCLGMLLAALKPSASVQWGVRTWVALVAILLVYFTIKFLMVVHGWHSNMYAVLHVLVFIACALSLFALCDPRLLGALKSVSVLWLCVSFVGGLTLEFYLVHSSLIQVVPLASIIFPLNLFLLFALTSVLAYAARFVTDGMVTSSRASDIRSQGAGRNSGVTRAPDPILNSASKGSSADGTAPQDAGE